MSISSPYDDLVGRGDHIYLRSPVALWASLDQIQQFFTALRIQASRVRFEQVSSVRHVSMIIPKRDSALVQAKRFAVKNGVRTLHLNFVPVSERDACPDVDMKPALDTKQVPRTSEAKGDSAGCCPLRKAVYC